MTNRRIYIAAALAVAAGKLLRLARRIAPPVSDERDDESEGLPDGWHDIDEALPMLDSGIYLVQTYGSTFWKYMGGESHWKA